MSGGPGCRAGSYSIAAGPGKAEGNPTFEWTLPPARRPPRDRAVLPPPLAGEGWEGAARGKQGGVRAALPKPAQRRRPA